MRLLSLALFTVWLITSVAFAASVKAEIVWSKKLSNHWRVSCEDTTGSGKIDFCNLTTRWAYGGKGDFVFNIVLTRQFRSDGETSYRTYINVPKYVFDDAEPGVAEFRFYGACNMKWTLHGVGIDDGRFRSDWNTTENFSKFLSCFKAARNFRFKIKQEDYHWYHTGTTKWLLTGSSKAVDEWIKISHQKLGTPSGKSDGMTDEMLNELLRGKPRGAKPAPHGPPPATTTEEWKF